MEKANCAMLVRPVRTAPAAFSHRTTGASLAAGGESSSAFVPASVTSPATSSMSLTEIGMPAIGDGACPALRRLSCAFAVSRARSTQTLTKVRFPSPAGSEMRARHSSVNEELEAEPDANARA